MTLSTLTGVVEGRRVGFDAYGTPQLADDSMTLTERQYERLLTWSNRVRAKLDAAPIEQLRRGTPQEADSCPLANTINYRVAKSRRLHVDESEAYRGEDPFAPDEVIAKTPEYVERFIRDFDRGKHPELDGAGWARA